MSVYLTTLNRSTETLHIFKCINVNEARSIQKRLAYSFSNSLSCFNITDKSNTGLNESQYKHIKRYTYEQNRSYYVRRSL